MPELTAEGRRIVEDVARRHGVSPGAAETLLAALVAGGGAQAQFSHPELGGMGQWSQGGMVMVGDMFNNALKARVDALAAELAGLLRSDRFAPPRPSQSQAQSQGSGGPGLFAWPAAGADWWPAELGSPGAVGAQNAMRYAVFPAARRLAVARGDAVTVYDTGEHRIGGVAQAQGGDATLTFTSQHGPVRLADLPVVEGGPPQAVPAGADGDVFAKIERLAELRAKQILTPEEFEAKKAELLARI